MSCQLFKSLTLTEATANWSWHSSHCQACTCSVLQSY